MKVSNPIVEEIPSDEAAALLVGNTRWYHSFEVRPGLVTPGIPYNAAAVCSQTDIPADLRGMKCLDIGPMDGPMTFELERRGAHTAALDVQDPTRVGFDAARRILGSKVVHYQGSVYDLPFEDLRDLDLVVFRGVYYHLKYPLLAFERISAAMRVGGMLHFEGAALLNYAEDLEGKPVEFRPDFVAEWNDKRVPVCLSYPNRYLGASNWFIPNPACLESWLIASGFEVHQMTPYIEGRSQRLYGRAVKTTNTGALLETDLY